MAEVLVWQNGKMKKLAQLSQEIAAMEKEEENPEKKPFPKRKLFPLVKTLFSTNHKNLKTLKKTLLKSVFFSFITMKLYIKFDM